MSLSLSLNLSPSLYILVYLGFDLSLLNSIYNKITKPLIISGGCGKLEDIKYIHENYKDTSVALASVLHYDILNIKKIKDLIN